MALRKTTLEKGVRKERRSPKEWQRVVTRLLAGGERAALARDADGLRARYAEVAEWDDPQRSFQARRHLTEIVFAAGERLPGESWVDLYLTALACVLDALEGEPSEPVLLNYAGVLMYELTELGGAEVLFRAAQRLDPQLPHVKKNLRAVRERRRGRTQLRPKGAVATALHAYSLRARRIAAAAKPLPGLRVSLCMIVKDEEEMLPGCLEAIRGAVDEIVIVDTGSTDRTVELAESFGAKVISFPWNGSFADARNVSLEAATGDWILYLDADEHLIDTDGPKLRALLGRTWREGFYLVETNYTGGDDAGSAVTHMALRLFRNRPAYRFEGRIHEQKTQNMPLYLPERFEATTVRVRHYGYLKSRINAKEKSRRNIELLEQEAREAPSPFNSFNLGSEHLALGDNLKARDCFDEAWDALRREGSWDGVGYAPILVSRVAKARRACGDLEAARAAIAEGLAVYPDYTDLIFEQAICSKQANELDDAAELAVQCLALGDAPARYTATVGTGTYLAQGVLAEVRALQGRNDEAITLLRSSLEEHAEYVAPILSLTSLLIAAELPTEEILAGLPVDRTSALLLAATAFYEGGRAEDGERLFREVLEQQPANGAARVGIVEALLSQRRYPEAAAEAALEPGDSPVAHAAALAQCFGLAAAGNATALSATIAEHADLLRPEEHGLYAAWADALEERAPAPLPLAAALPLATALEALLRVADVDPFVVALPLLELVPLEGRERRELLARMYLRRGFVESAADEWIEVMQEAPDARALLGLAQVAVAQANLEDALVFATEAVGLEPENTEAARLRAAVEERLLVAA
ncbi:MAG: glycosyltransferase [Gaiellaceae bacterium]